MDKLKHIKKLIDKFYEGETDWSEEQELMSFFKNKDVPEELKGEKEMFLSMNDLIEDVDVPDDLNEKIIDRIDEAEKRDSRGKRLTLISLSGLAAGLIIILSVYLGFIKGNSGDQLAQYEIEDPQVAYEEIRKTFEFVSEKWNTGTGELKNLGTIQQSMESIRPINKLSSGSKELNLLGNINKAKGIHLQ